MAVHATELLISLQRTVNRFNRRLLRLRAPAAAYLRAKLATSEGTDEVYSKLQEKVESPGFLEKLRESRAATGEPGEGEAEAPPSEAPLGRWRRFGGAASEAPRRRRFGGAASTPCKPCHTIHNREPRPAAPATNVPSAGVTARV